MSFAEVKAIEALKKTLLEGSTSSNTHSSKIGYFTAALVFVGVVQIFVTLTPYISQHMEKNVRKACFQSVLQTSDIDLNYKNCLRNNGLAE